MRADEPAIGRMALDAVDRLVGLDPRDRILLVSDPTADPDVVDAIAGALGDGRRRCCVAALDAALGMGDELPAQIEAAFSSAAVALIVSTWFPSWVATRGVWRAIHEYGTRVLHFDPPHRPVLELGVTDSDLAAIAANGRCLRDRVDGATGVLIVDRFGDELRCAVDYRNCLVSRGFPLQFGFDKLPTGLFTLSVLPGTYDGRVVWDAVDGIPMKDGDAIKVEVEKGVVTAVHGIGAGMEYVAAKVAISPAYGQVTEFGIGTNPSIPEEAFLRERWHEAANRSAGIVHFGIGSAHTATGAAGRLPFHTHLVARGATVYALPAMTLLVEGGRIAA